MRGSDIKFSRRVLLSIIGLILLGTSVGFFLYANLGADTASTFAMGISAFTGLAFGHANALVNLILLTPVFFVDRSYIHLSTILAMLIIGYVGQLSLNCLELLFSVDPGIYLRYGSLFAGIALMGFAIPLYVRAGLGVGAVDLPAELISDKLGWSYRLVRIACDFLYVAIGVLLGGTFGIGTVITVILLGPTIAFFRKTTNRLGDLIMGVSI